MTIENIDIQATIAKSAGTDAGRRTNVGDHEIDV